MAIKLEINMTNKWLYSLIAVGIVLALGVGVYAYNSNMRTGNPSIMGHSAGEINVENSAGEVVSLQDALDDLGGSSGGISQLKTTVIECNGNCADEGTPNEICSSRHGASFKALSVDCECIEVSGSPIRIDKTFDGVINWCCDTDGEDITVTCYS